MDKKTMLALGALVLVVGFIVFDSSKPAPQQIGQSSAVSSAQTSGEGGVTLDVTPVDISPQAKTWTFTVAMNTHSVELGSPMQSMTLVDAQGKVYTPTAWDGPTEGHHMNGTLTFTAITPTPKSIELRASIPGEAGKTFTWNL